MYSKLRKDKFIKITIRFLQERNNSTSNEYEMYSIFDLIFIYIMFLVSCHRSHIPPGPRTQYIQGLLICFSGQDTCLTSLDDS